MNKVDFKIGDKVRDLNGVEGFVVGKSRYDNCNTDLYVVDFNGLKVTVWPERLIGLTDLPELSHYPKNYYECCSVLGVYEQTYLKFGAYSKDVPKTEEDIKIRDYEEKALSLVDSIRRIIICRDAFWKVIGLDKGLDGPWSPDWSDSDYYYCLNFNKEGTYTFLSDQYHLLAFPNLDVCELFEKKFASLLSHIREMLYGGV